MHELRAVRMTDAERSELRARLRAHIAMHPACTSLWSLVARHTLAYSMTAVFLIAGSTFALACYAKPDSLLYPVRVAITDPIAVTVSGNEDAQLGKELEQIGHSITEEENITKRELTLKDEDYSDHRDDKLEIELDKELNTLQRELDDAARDLPAEE